MIHAELQDLHSTERAQALFKEQRALLLLIQEMKDGVLVCDKNQQVLLFNEALKNSLSLNPSILTQPCVKAIPSLDLEAAMAQVLTTGKATTQELTLNHNNLKLYFHIHLIPLIVTDKIDGCVAIFHDETAIRQTEKMRRDFVANVSHELRTPLSAIHGYAETLLDGALEDKKTAWDFVNVIFRHSKRLSQLVTDLLDLSKLESFDFEPELDPTSLRHMINKVHSLAESSAAGKNLTLFIHLPDNLPYVMANRSNLEQVLTNLLDNAIKYTPEGGKIAISAFETHEADENKTESAPEDSMIQINVTDTGMGIEPKHAARLFERFYRVDKARSREMGGTGLGLSIVKHIVQYHGGDIWVESQPDKGSTFSFTLKKAEDLDDTL